MHSTALWDVLVLVVWQFDHDLGKYLDAYSMGAKAQLLCYPPASMARFRVKVRSYLT